MKCTQSTLPKPFEPIKIEIVFENASELQYMCDKVGGWAGSGTYPLYELLSNLVATQRGEQNMRKG